MKIFTLLAVLLLVPQIATARVYMCVDHETGKTSFTDKACEAPGSREEVRMDAVNLDSGNRDRVQAKPKTWSSQAETRRSGLDYSAERRGSLYQNSATASTQ